MTGKETLKRNIEEYKFIAQKIKTYEQSSLFQEYKKDCKKEEKLRKIIAKQKYNSLSKQFLDKLLPILKQILLEANITMPIKEEIYEIKFEPKYIKSFESLANLINLYSKDKIYCDDIIIVIDKKNRINIELPFRYFEDWDELFDTTILTFIYLPNETKITEVAYSSEVDYPYLNKITKYINHHYLSKKEILNDK